MLVGDAQMPGGNDLLRRNAYTISDRRWPQDVSQLLDILVWCPRNFFTDFRVCGPDAALLGVAVALLQLPSRALPQDHIHRK